MGVNLEDAKWYVLHTYSGYENMVKENLEMVFAKNGKKDRLLEITIPLEDVVEEKNGKRKIVQRRMFPCYVIIKMVYDNSMWHMIVNTRGVTGFVGPGSKPVPLTDAEMRPLGIKSDNIVVDFDEGDTVVVIGGVWKDTIGVIQRMDHGKQICTINVDLFGRETPVEISFSDVKKMN